MFENIINKIKEYKTIIIHRHVRPDGDCIGAQMGLKQFIIDNFPDKEVYAVGDNLPEYLKYIGQNDTIEDKKYEGSLVIVVDTSNEERICDDRWKKGEYIIKIDHHDDSPLFGDIQFVDEKSPSCSSILVTIFKSFPEYLISKKTAFALFFGITTDTGRFRYRGVNGEVFRNAALLVDKDIDIQVLYDRLYATDFNTLKLQGFVYNNFKLTKNGVAYIYFTKKIMKKYHVSKEDAGNLVNSLGSIKGSLIWVAFIDQVKPAKKISKDINNKNEIRCRIRSRGVAINDIAANYRGGGHLQASGATIYSKKEMKNLLNDLDASLKKYKEENPYAF